MYVYIYMYFWDQSEIRTNVYQGPVDERRWQRGKYCETNNKTLYQNFNWIRLTFKGCSRSKKLTL